MRKERITDKEATCILIIFYIGSSFILGVGTGAKNDAWISVLLGVSLSIPIVLVYGRLLSLFPEKGLYDIVDQIFGKVIGKLVAIIYIWYTFHLGALIMRNFGEFINTSAMPETPLFVPILCLGIVSIVAVRSGIEVIGRISATSLPFLLFIIVVVQFMGIPQLHFHYIKPILGNGFSPIMKAGFSTFAFPFAESVVLLGAFFSLKTKVSPLKIFLKGTVFAGLLIFFITLRNILILGGILPKLYFPAHVAVSRIIIGDFLQRIELTVAVIFIFGVFIKGSICLLVCSIGFAKLFNLHDYRSIVIQNGLLMIFFAYTIYDSIFEMRKWAFEIYTYYAFPFQVIIPLLMLVIAEIKVRVDKKQSTNSIESG
ncbi:endospore germination permease [Neobacillus sp. OS1-2]|uniref:GerAB/ArcD/ProY family transporter n=1 Tax=Neobacillus sp. OS1-2 TaxID=3070680 RepID=UPI0027E13961|nr:endospore germination permease [Neobacillus sp. OS1-2]WML39708.1 endospore germination permease [Neobacillus sp. OS1-2]